MVNVAKNCVYNKNDSFVGLQQGDVAQMVEYSLSMRRVQGSIPCFSKDSVLLLMRPVFGRSLVCIRGFLVLVSLTHYFSTTLKDLQGPVAQWITRLPTVSE
jgi:hypothetical protein